MTDNASIGGPQNNSYIAMGEDDDVRYWTGKFGVSQAMLEEAVDAVGTSAVAVEEYLR